MVYTYLLGVTRISEEGLHGSQHYYLPSNSIHLSASIGSIHCLHRFSHARCGYTHVSHLLRKLHIFIFWYLITPL